MSNLSNFLTDLADKVRAADAASVEAEQTVIDKALEAGSLLCQARDATKYGEWLPFLDRTGIGERRAQGLMQIFRAGLKSATVADLGGLKASLAYLAQRKLPEKGQVSIIGRKGWLDSEDRKTDQRNPIMVVWPSLRHPKFFEAAIIDLSVPDILEMKPAKPDGIWAFLELYHPVPASEREFTIASELAPDIEDMRKLLNEVAL